MELLEVSAAGAGAGAGAGAEAEAGAAAGAEPDSPPAVVVTTVLRLSWIMVAVRITPFFRSHTLISLPSTMKLTLSLTTHCLSCPFAIVTISVGACTYHTVPFLTSVEYTVLGSVVVVMVL